MSEAVVRKGGCFWVAVTCQMLGPKPLVGLDLECSRHFERTQGKKKTLKRVPKPWQRPQEREGSMHSRSRLASGHCQQGDIEGPRLFGFGLAWGRVHVHTMNDIIRPGSLQCSNLGMHLNETPTAPQPGFGKIRRSCPLASGLQAKSTACTWLFEAVVNKSGLI